MFEDLLATAISAARKAASILVERFQSLTVAEADLKGRNDYVTEVDLESERTIIETILARYPDHSILAEESGLHAPGGGVRWIIDPLDGTTNYIHGFPVFSISIAAEAQGRIVAGVVLDPLRDELFAAARGNGATLNGKPIKVSPSPDFARSLILTGFPFKAQHYLEDFITVFRDMLPVTSGIRRCGSAAIDLSYVARGRAEGFWEFGLSPWDIAAGSLIVEEAGGRVTDVELGSHQLDTGNVLASNGLIHQTLQEVITRHFPKDHFFRKASRPSR
jgi:myo-inositol-1(or 4)-monophosphatase